MDMEIIVEKSVEYWKQTLIVVLVLGGLGYYLKNKLGDYFYDDPARYLKLSVAFLLAGFVAIILQGVLQSAFGIKSMAEIKRISNQSIIEFELAGSVDESKGFVEGFEAVQVEDDVRGTLWLDFLFIIFFVGVIFGLNGMGLYLLSHLGGPDQANSILMALGFWAQVMILFSGLLDVIEDTALFVLLGKSESAFWPALLTWVTLPKFVFVLGPVLIWLVLLIGLLI